MANELFVPSFYGYGEIQKTAGAAANPAVGTQWVFPAIRYVPFNILGNQYPSVINASGYPSVKYQGKVRPGCTIFAYVKPATTTSGITYGVDANLLNALLFNLSAAVPYTTDRFSIKITDLVTSARVFDWARCTHVVLSAGSSGGPCILQMGFISRWGETQAPYGTTLPDGEVVPAAVTFGTPTAASVGASGELDDVIDYDFRSDGGVGTGSSGATWTATQVRGFTLHLMRGQGPIDYMDGTRYAKEIASGMFSGALALEHNPATSTTPTNSATLRLHTNGSASQGIKIAMLLSKDSNEWTFDPGIASETLNYTLYDSSTGGNPATCTAYSPA